MDAYLYMEAHLEAIEPVTDFTYKWCTNMGMESDEAARFSLATDELLTDMILFAYPDELGYIEIWYRYSVPQLEIIIQDSGEPFDPDHNRYSRDKAISEGHFEGAGLEIVRNMTEHFLFLNRGKEGKEFRLSKQLSEQRFTDLETEKGVESEEAKAYQIDRVAKEDAEDIAKLIYRSYGYSYVKEDVYFPKQNRLAIERGKKFGVLARTDKGRPVGYLVVIKSGDSMVGEVGEAVVSPAHRRKGLMTRMLKELISISQKRGLRGLYGLALTTHEISQKANQAFGFTSVALPVAVTKGSRDRAARADHPQPISLLVDFLPLTKTWNRPLYLPAKYESILNRLYEQFDTVPASVPPEGHGFSDEGKTDMELKFTYRNNTAFLTVKRLGSTFRISAKSMLRSLNEVNLNAIFIDLPLQEPSIDEAVEFLNSNGFIFSGLMPMAHQQQDYFRMQKIMVPIDFDLIQTYSETAGLLKELIRKEYHELQKVTQ